MGPTATHVVLLGDSVFDSSAYAGGEPDVVTLLREFLPGGWHATLCAVAGATTSELAAQFPRIPLNGSHVVVASGGRDALRNIDFLSTRPGSAAETLRVVAHRVAEFESCYRGAMHALGELNFRTCACTIPHGPFEAGTLTVADVTLALFNDVIVRTAIAFGMDVLELRSICTEPPDYATPLEPSRHGRRKIALAVANMVGPMSHLERPTHAWSGEIRVLD